MDKHIHSNSSDSDDGCDDGGGGGGGGDGCDDGCDDYGLNHWTTMTMTKMMRRKTMKTSYKIVMQNYFY